MLSSVYKWRLLFIASHPVFAVNNTIQSGDHEANHTSGQRQVTRKVTEIVTGHLMIIDKN